MNSQKLKIQIVLIIWLSMIFPPTFSGKAIEDFPFVTSISSRTIDVAEPYGDPVTLVTLSNLHFNNDIIIENLTDDGVNFFKRVTTFTYNGNGIYEFEYVDDNNQTGTGGQFRVKHRDISDTLGYKTRIGWGTCSNEEGTWPCEKEIRTALKYELDHNEIIVTRHVIFPTTEVKTQNLNTDPMMIVYVILFAIMFVRIRKYRR